MVCMDKANFTGNEQQAYSANKELGLYYIDNKRFDEALSYLNAAILCDVKNQSEAFFLRGLTYFKKKNLESAMEDFDRSLRVDPNLALANNFKGIIYHAKGQLEMAIEQYREAIKKMPDLKEALYNLGFAYQSRGEYDRARELYAQALKVNKNFEPARSRLCELLDGMARQ